MVDVVSGRNQVAFDVGARVHTIPMIHLNPEGNSGGNGNRLRGDGERGEARKRIAARYRIFGTEKLIPVYGPALGVKGEAVLADPIQR